MLDTFYFMLIFSRKIFFNWVSTEHWTVHPFEQWAMPKRFESLSDVDKKLKNIFCSPQRYSLSSYIMPTDQLLRLLQDNQFTFSILTSHWIPTKKSYFITPDWYQHLLTANRDIYCLHDRNNTTKMMSYDWIYVFVRCGLWWFFLYVLISLKLWVRCVDFVRKKENIL